MKVLKVRLYLLLAVMLTMMSGCALRDIIAVDYEVVEASYCSLADNSLEKVTATAVLQSYYERYELDVDVDSICSK